MARVRLATLRHGTETTAAVETATGFAAVDAPDVGALLAMPVWRSVVELATAAPERIADADAVYAPVIVAPRKIVCCGHNYAEHIAELGRPVPEYPTLFAKFADTLTGPFDDIVLDGTSSSVDWEAELAVVIGADLRHASADEALAGIAGYTIANDISMRDWQARTPQWLQGKAFDGTTPLGPVLVTADELDPVAGLEITCRIGDEVVQRGSTGTLVFDAAHLVAYVSQFTRLRPGDIVLTGTPGGVGMARTPPRFLADGDVLTTTIQGIGTMTNAVRALTPATSEQH